MLHHPRHQRALRRLVTLATGAAVVAGPLAVLPTPATAAAGPAVRAVQAAPAAPATPAEVWTPVDDVPQAQRDGLRRRVHPSAYAGYHLDLDSLTDRLGRAPAERSDAAPLLLEVPAPNGELVEFAVTESPVMERGLAERHPDIATYAGRTTSGSPASIRLDVTPMGFHASVRGAGSAWYVDPAYNGPDQGTDALYLSYLGSDLPEPEQPLVEPEVPEAEGLRADGDDRSRVGEGPGAVAIQRTYRLALVTDPSYRAYFTTSTDPAVANAVVTAEKTTLMNRVNQIYGDDFSIRLLLVAATDATNFNTAAAFTGANGPCGPSSCYTSADIGCGDVIDTNRYVLGTVVGADRYDIGHIAFGPDGDGGGVAYLGSVGGQDKAGGCTGLNPPSGDSFAVDYVAHEMGHQFAGNHTFNGTTGSCAGDNRNNPTAVEPGSGTSVMAYAGICGVDNLQPHSDPYFSQRSQTEVAAFTRGTQPALSEKQNVALTGYDAGEAFTLTFGSQTTAPIVRGSNFTASGIQAAVQAATGGTVTVRGHRGGTFSTSGTGFELTWSGTADIARPTLTVTSGTFTGLVGVTDNGGAATNQGFDNPAPTGNRNPVVTAPAARTIPLRTPFTLSGSATDPDGDPLVYSWEQNDAGAGTGLNNNTKTTGPLFRIFGTWAAGNPAGTYGGPGTHAMSTSPTRSFPDALQVAAGETNAATGTCGSLSGTGTTDSAALRCYSEFLPRAARSLSFRLTARDLGGADGGTSFADTTLTVGTAGPFAVTSQGASTSVEAGTTGSIGWNVAGTDTSTYATHVRITFSTDGGRTFPTELVASTPNDGAETVTWPDVATTTGRVRVEAVGNYFYDVNDGAITVTAPTVTPTLTTGGTLPGATLSAASSDPLPGTPTITASSNVVAGSVLTATSSTLPTGLSLTRTASSGGEATFTVSGVADVDPGTYPVSVTVSDGPGNAADQTVSFTIVVTKDVATLVYTGQTSSAGGAVTVSATVADTDATPGTVAGTVAFTDQTTGDALCSATVSTGAASCTFEAAASRTYQVVGTLSGVRYTGASTPAQVVVTVPALTLGGNASGGTFSAPSSDPLSSTVTITASSNVVAGSAIQMTATGLPAGLTLGRTATTASGTTFTVSGVADVDPGSYPVSVTVSDGPGNADDRTVSFTVVVTKDVATLVYTGQTSSAGGAVTVSATVTDTDATSGTVAGTVAFTDRTTGDALCSTAVTAGTASCTFEAAASRTFQVVATLSGVRYSGASTPAQLVVTVPDPVLTTGGNAAGGVFTASSTDPVDQDVILTASSNKVAGTAITATAAGLPSGLRLERTTSEAGSTTFVLAGSADVDPRTYPVTVTVSDGPGNAADSTVSFSIVVSRDDAVLTYTGPATGTGGPTTVSVSVVDHDDARTPVRGDVVFTDRVTGARLCSGAVMEDTASASCTFVAQRTRTYEVVAALDGVRHAGATTTAATLVVTLPDTTPPDTRITAGPAQGSVQLARVLTFRFAAEAGATYTCTLGTASAPCDAGSVTLRDLAAGTYDFTVAARDAAGNVDPTPAVRRFHVPVDDRALRASGPWKRRSATSAYRGTYSTVGRAGSTLSLPVSGASSLALVVADGRGYGTVELYLGKRRLARVPTAGAPRSRRVVMLPAFARPTSGTVRIVTTSARPVRIDGLAVRAATASRPSGVRGVPLV